MELSLIPQVGTKQQSGVQFKNVWSSKCANTQYFCDLSEFTGV